jgi:hypothetical protein
MVNTLTSPEAFYGYKNKRAALEKLRLTPEEKARWLPMFHETWHAIADDIQQGLAEVRVKLTRPMIVECVCDADHVRLYGGMTEEEYTFMGVCYDRPSFQRWLRKELNYA